MRETATVRSYNAGAMLLHWAIAALIVLQIAGGFALARLAVVPQALQFTAIQWHKTFGLAILALTLARIVWRLLNRPPAGAPTSGAERRLAGAVHFLFYALMLAVPLTGWLMVSASPRRIPTLLFLQPSFPFAHLPVPGGAREAVAGLAVDAHAVLAYSFLGLLALHVAGALKHSVVDRAPSFRRMLPTGRLRRAPTAPAAVPLAGALAVLFVVGGVELGRRGETAALAAAPAGPAADAPAASGGWRIDHAVSTLGYEVTFSGKPMRGAVGRWDAAVRFDPADLGSASATITADAASITADDPFVGGSVAGSDGFDAAAHPRVAIRLDRFERAGEGYVGRGTLEAKGRSVPVEVPFSFERQADGSARVAGSATVDRVALGLGLANDPTAQWLGREVVVRLDLRAAPVEAPGAPPV